MTSENTKKKKTLTIFLLPFFVIHLKRFKSPKKYNKLYSNLKHVSSHIFCFFIHHTKPRKNIWLLSLFTHENIREQSHPLNLHLILYKFTNIHIYIADIYIQIFLHLNSVRCFKYRIDRNTLNITDQKTEEEKWFMDLWIEAKGSRRTYSFSSPLSTDRFSKIEIV